MADPRGMRSFLLGLGLAVVTVFGFTRLADRSASSPGSDPPGGTAALAPTTAIAPPPEPGDLPPARHETQDITFRQLAIGFALVLLVLLGCAGLAIWMYPTSLVDRRLPTPLAAYPTPRLQANPPADLRAFLAQERARLNGTGWVDRAAGIAHIPIADAMQRIATQGIPDWPARPKQAAK